MNDNRPHPFLEMTQEKPGGLAAAWRLRRCPAPDCREPIPDERGAVIDHLEAEHGPEDFGLSPLVEPRRESEPIWRAERNARGGPRVAGGGRP